MATTTPMPKAELAAAVRDATNLVSTRDAANLLERVAALRSGGEPEARILARLNGPADPRPLDDAPTASRGNAGMQLTPAQRIERANRVSAETLADHIAAKVIAAMIDREAKLDEAEDMTIPDPPEDATAPPVVTDMTVCKDGHPPYAHPRGVACLPCAQANGTVATATTQGEDVTAAEWQRAKEPPADPKRRLRATGREVLNLLRPLPLTGLKPGLTMQEIALQLDIEYPAATGRVQSLYRNGLLERTRLGGAFVYRLAVEWDG